jgi:crotonobetainyl-CoA:carnitine CoA-transferase CaiB-like acyl-CoA transferase
LDYLRNGRVLERNGNRDPAMAAHGVFPCQGHDRWVAVAVDSDETWRALCEELGRADLARLRTAERLTRVDELEGVVADWTSRFDEDEAERRLQARGVPAHVVANSPESWRDPQLAHRGHFVTTDHALHGPLVVEGSRWRFSRTPPTTYRAAPTLGQDGFEVLNGLLGYDVDRIADLAAAELLE